MGSSHGWLALLRPHHNGFYLYNPISRRYIELPSIFNLPIVFKDKFFLYNPISGGLIKLPSILNLATFFKDDILNVTKVILSCSPDEDEENCRVVIVRDDGPALAFCCSGRSKEWTFMLDEERGERFYKDCVYSTSQNLFFGLTHDNELETWDLGDPSSPKLIKVDQTNIKQGHFYSLVDTFLLSCGTKEHLVVAKEDLLLVIQYIAYHVGPDGSCFDNSDNSCPYNSRHMTIGFDIFKCDSEKGKFEYLDRSSLGDLAIFVGKHSHSVAIQATEFPGVKPNSVYFTDAYGTGYLEGGELELGVESYHDIPICGHDNGIYNYQDKIVSPCYYPCDASSVKTITTAPI
ncbi:hypothetical protein CASFOL_026547 [Castilleja foliolosa]|uniref:KIB1-4 beta-propeller domain-containing protein n=1 Tax=Castilleja foliolosa TaxID=1961234 RepID=A0ABD3CHC7_9LAMI